MNAFEREPDEVLAELAALREADAPTHGGRVLSYVYDSGLAELDELAARAARLVQPVNGLDPTTFTSVAAMEAGVVGFARRVFHGEAAGEAGPGAPAPGAEVVGSVTSGGTESCLLAVKTARDVWREANHGDERMPRLVAPTTVHAAFHKAAHYFGLELELVPVSADTGAPDVADVVARLDDDVALVVMSAPSYPFATLDPIGEVASATAERGIALHVDACIGGFALAFRDGLPDWDFRVPGVTSLSADLHKYGYAPKGVSVLLQRGRDRQRRQYFATTAWPGYPVVNPTMAGSKPAGPLAAAWAIVQVLGEPGFAELTARATTATATLREAIDGIEGLEVVGDPVGPLLAVRSDASVPSERRVDPHHWADAARGAGWHLQLQPGMFQSDGTVLPHTTHLTVTPVTDHVVGELVPALAAAADAVRGVPAIDGGALVGGLIDRLPGGATALAASSGPDSDTAAALLSAFGLLGGKGAGGALPERMAPVLALVEALPGPLTERLLVELLARVVEPR
ncbi:pyridoxal phosphate-dependent decarboxylase family protein [Agromyces bracchium]|uniref:Aminotransferase class V-fold PLP-dependent enzyme n=1 Tax=Agromyces bracchium TaxID=88376 RepID=A0A6I3M918_9MICO|nr:aminotransferase class V-fold PLP-dependent enzyme [Agromyces bracchium]MTH68557.1 aminotransferase class V-fold PLP-dependent enzyme [Agromyces bracchium]